MGARGITANVASLVRAVFPAALLLAAYGCAGSTDFVASKPSKPSKPCMTDADCSATEKCALTSTSGMHPARLPLSPCASMPACTATSDCDAGLTCLPIAALDLPSTYGCPEMVCLTPCTASSCTADEVCGSDGACKLLRCDEPGASPCSEHWRCDPTAAATEPGGLAVGAFDTEDPARAIARGCVRERCDEPGGFVCRDNWECAPARSLEGTGCAAIPCGVLGHCGSDAAFICVPTSSEPRPDGTDPFGCVYRNCEEGSSCQFIYQGQDLGYCNPKAPDADAYGCSVHNCLEDSSICAADHRCAPTDPNADHAGCTLTCAEGEKCGTDWSTCVPL